MGFMKKKRILITGISNKLSIAYGIACAMYQQNAKLAFTYQTSRLKSRVDEIAKNFDSNIVIKCDVSSDEDIRNLFLKLKKIWNKFDGFVHSIAYAPADQLNGDYVENVTREGFRIAHDISSYSFVALAKECKKMLNPGSALLTISYLGSKCVFPNYNVMGLAKASLETNVKYMSSAMGKKNIRVNAISTGPVRTLASSGIKNFRKMFLHFKKVSPLVRSATIQEIGNCAAFLCSDLSSAITGEVLYVDCGFKNMCFYSEQN